MARILVFLLWAGAALFWGSVQLAYHAGWRLNHTASLPMGLWRVTPVTRPLMRGDVVGLCPPDTPLFRLARKRGYLGHGACPGNYEPLLKPVAAVAGDVVEIAGDGVTVNGVKIDNSAARGTDRQGRAMPHLQPGKFMVMSDESWLISSHHPASFDSRYFGPITGSQITGIAERR